MSANATAPFRPGLAWQKNRSSASSFAATRRALRLAARPQRRLRSPLRVTVPEPPTGHLPGGRQRCLRQRPRHHRPSRDVNLIGGGPPRSPLVLSFAMRASSTLSHATDASPKYRHAGLDPASSRAVSTARMTLFGELFFQRADARWLDPGSSPG
jgi:hypothetical protein